MSEKFVYTQEPNKKAFAHTPGNNVRHLQYIATRPGAMYNTGCGFCLWGHLPGDEGIRIQQDLTWAKQLIRQVSKEHTLYRCVLSVGHEDATEKGLYSRERWEDLVNDHVQVIAKENDIRPENFCWAASMHYAKGHPHVHLLFWDNGNDPRPEYIPRPLYVRKMESIRAAFSGDLFREEIRQEQQEQREDTKTLRSMLRSVCLEANPGKALNIPKLFKGEALSILSKGLLELARDAPTKGSLDYGYLKPEYKQKVNAFVGLCLEQVPELAKEEAKYEAHTRRISELYSNGETSAAATLDKAREKLRKELANEVMKAVRTALKEGIRELPLEDGPKPFLQEATQEILPKLDSYRELRDRLPPERIPVSAMAKQIPGYSEGMNKVVEDVLADARVRVRLQGWADEKAREAADKEAPSPTENMEATPEETLAAAGGEDAVPPEKPVHPKEPGEPGNVEAAREEARQEAYREAWKEAKRELRREITEQLRRDAGWTDELARTRTAFMACEMLRLVSQLASQKGAALNQGRLNSKRRSRNMSREERQHNRAVRSQGSSWEAEF